MSGINGAKPRSQRRARYKSFLAAGAAAALVTGPLATTSALAQTLDTSGTFASAKVGTVPSANYGMAPLPQPEALVPQFNAYLNKYGAAVLLNNVNEFSAAVSGPRQGSANAGQYGLEWDQDWNTLANIPGLETHAVAVGRYGIPASPIFGDNLNPSQEIYGAGGNVAIHLVFFYAEETLAHGRVALAAGRFPTQNDFDANPLNCNFMQNSLCGNPKAIGDNVSNSSYPDAAWAFRARVRPIAPVYIQAGVFFSEDNIYNATDGYRSGFHLNAAHINGQLFPLEVGYEPKIGADQMPGHYKLGVSYDNVNHNTWTLSGLPQVVRKGGSQAWASADQMLIRQGPGATDGIILMGNYVHNDPRYSTRSDEYIVSAIDRHFWNARPFDTIGALFAYTTVSGRLSRLQAQEQEAGLPISGSFVGDTAIPNGVQSHTMNFELNYQIHVYRGITFAPDFQYFIRPNAQTNLPDAAMIGFKSNIELF